MEIYTDGCSLQRPRVGGIGIRFLTVAKSGEEQIDDIQLPGFKNATNNQMELQACITALNEATKLAAVADATKISVYTDSLYVADNYKKAMFEWPNTRWRSPSGRPILNADLWKELVRAMRRTRKRVEFRWVKGHSKNNHNRAVDRLARESARNALNEPLSVVHVRRKRSHRSVEQGSVKMERQRLSIRIITTEYLPVQRLWKCKYEVISRTSPYTGRVDIIFSETLLKAGHNYYVRVNDNPGNPTVESVVRELRPRSEEAADP